MAAIEEVNNIYFSIKFFEMGLPFDFGSPLVDAEGSTKICLSGSELFSLRGETVVGEQEW